MRRTVPPTSICIALLGAWVLLALVAASAGSSEVRGRGVAMIAIDGPIGPATTDFVRRGIAEAERTDALALIIRIDTPGGLDAATRDIDRAILGAAVPVVAWVAPGGARAASAGTFILYATHVAAMAPGTHLGAATPVPLGGAPASPESERRRDRDRNADRDRGSEDDGDEATAAADGDATTPATAMERKAINDAVAYIRTMAELRGRNADWAERAVRLGESITARQALQLGVIEIIAADLSALLEALDGREITIGADTLTLATAGAVVGEIEPDWRNRLLSVLTNPSIAYLLLLAGLYGLLLEGYNPGAMVPGVTGVVCLLLAAYALQVLPVNYVGLALIVLGVLLMVGELLTPSFGVLGIGGLSALVLGSIVLFDTDVPGFAVSRGLIGGIAFVSGGMFMMVLVMLGRSRRRPVTTGTHELLSHPALALDSFTGRGRVRARGEVWQAHSEVPVMAGDELEVVAVDGLTLHVRPRAAAR